MVKPVLARPASRRQPMLVQPNDQPELFAFIREVCSQVRAPVPGRVQLDCQVNASASLGAGPLNLRQRDLVLTIGMPLVAGLSVRQLGGVLAHEFGHFAQGGGMRLTTLIRGVNAWFARVVFERDHWDQKLDEWSREGDWRLIIVFRIASASIGLSRLVLRMLMTAGHVVSCFMMRQMEFDADSYEIKFAGSAAFAETSARMRQLGVAVQFGYADLREAWQKGTLPDDFSAYIVKRSAHLPEEVLSHLREAQSRRSGLFDTHPSDDERVRAAESARADGVLVGGAEPATSLFRNFERVSARATRQHYEHDLGLDLGSVMLVGIGDAIAESEGRQQASRALEAFFAGRASTFRPLKLPPDEPETLDAAALLARMDAAARRMEASDGSIARRYQHDAWLGAREERAWIAEQVLRAGRLLSSSEEFELAEGTLEDAISTQQWAIEQRQSNLAALEGFERDVVERLACGLYLAKHATPQHTDHRLLIDTFNLVSSTLPGLFRARRFVAAGVFIDRASQDPKQALLTPAAVESANKEAEAWFGGVREMLGDTPCPPSLASQPTTIAAWCGLAGGGQLTPLDGVNRMLAIYWGLLTEIIVIVGEVERRFSDQSASA